ncbi:fibronectin type 3 and ankyrin repeat domains protein 1 [Phtheirospermum japonicum]|uniref:Fibronectin type 3 and ankyrin repeat domains protein 1 n=1 Tax=Phtheirospermum japonicum TaxID=374723 RepID=A0A830BNC5_9LAMI|nr:fibronectin type 3 and ankyrin repeat domains protein 1 [Phtheirospermum japonicum]
MAKALTTTATDSSGVGGRSQRLIGRKQHGNSPVRFEAEPISQRLVAAAHADDRRLASELVSHPSIDVNFIGTVSLKSRKTEVVLNGESASEVCIEFEEFRTDVTPLFLAAHNGNLTLVTELLNAGANVDQKLFRGYATTAAVREGNVEVLELLLNSGAGQAACEEALLEACYLGRAGPAELLMGSDMIRPHVAVHALVTACSRGFVDFVETLIKNGVDANANARILLQSSKPSLYANVDCNGLVAAIVSRQVSVVQLLLKIGCRTDSEVRLGTWSWDVTTGEELRVGVGLAEPYTVTWCAVEYFESSGVILRTLLHHISPNTPHLGRTIIHHAILCRNSRAFDALLSCGADIESSVEITAQHGSFRALHLAARFGLAAIIRLSINAGCNLNSKTGSGETALMICARHKHEECLKLLASSGSDLGLTNMSNQSAMWIAGSGRWALGFQRAVLDVIRGGKIVKSSNPEIFSPLLFVARANDVDALRKLIKQPNLDINEKDENGFTAVMVAAAGGHVETFRLLVNAGANLETQNNYGETAITLAEKNQNSDGLAILDELARKMVLSGARVRKHTKAGKGAPHVKMLRMVEGVGVLSWGKSSKRNVICRGAEVGPSSGFRWNRKMKGDDPDDPGVFRVVTTKNREIHFSSCRGGIEMARLWVRGIRLVTRQAIFGRDFGDA